MSLRTRALPDRLPEPARRWALRTLFRATADAFGASMPELRGGSADAILERYTAFTDERSRDLLLDPLRRPIVERRLRASTERMGRRIRTLLGIRTTAEALEVAHRLYALIGIDLDCDATGRVVVTRCAFAARYSPEVCQVMSAPDVGLLEGLTGGGRLTFTDRLTSGAPACLATLVVDAEARG